MKLSSIRIDRAPGIFPGFVLDELGWLNLVHGPNGSGKSTVVRTLRALLWPDLFSAKELRRYEAVAVFSSDEAVADEKSSEETSQISRLPSASLSSSLSGFQQPEHSDSADEAASEPALNAKPAEASAESGTIRKRLLKGRSLTAILRDGQVNWESEGKKVSPPSLPSEEFSSCFTPSLVSLLNEVDTLPLEEVVAREMAGGFDLSAHAEAFLNGPRAAAQERSRRDEQLQKVRSITERHQELQDEENQLPEHEKEIEELRKLAEQEGALKRALEHLDDQEELLSVKSRLEALPEGLEKLSPGIDQEIERRQKEWERFEQTVARGAAEQERLKHEISRFSEVFAAVQDEALEVADQQIQRLSKYEDEIHRLRETFFQEREKLQQGSSGLYLALSFEPESLSELDTYLEATQRLREAQSSLNSRREGVEHQMERLRAQQDPSLEIGTLSAEISRLEESAKALRGWLRAPASSGRGPFFNLTAAAALLLVLMGLAVVFFGSAGLGALQILLGVGIGVRLFVSKPSTDDERSVWREKYQEHSPDQLEWNEEAVESALADLNSQLEACVRHKGEQEGLLRRLEMLKEQKWDLDREFAKLQEDEQDLAEKKEKLLELLNGLRPIPIIDLAVRDQSSPDQSSVGQSSIGQSSRGQSSTGQSSGEAQEFIEAGGRSSSSSMSGGLPRNWLAQNRAFIENPISLASLLQRMAAARVSLDSLAELFGKFEFAQENQKRHQARLVTVFRTLALKPPADSAEARASLSVFRRELKRYRELTVALRELSSNLEYAASQKARLRGELEGLWKQVGLAPTQMHELRNRLSRLAEFEELKAMHQKLQHAVEMHQSSLASLDDELLYDRQKIEERLEQSRQARSRHDELVERRGGLKEKIARQFRGDELQLAKDELLQAEEALSEGWEAILDNELAGLLIEDLREKHDLQSRPEVLRTADAYFRDFTRNAYGLIFENQRRSGSSAGASSSGFKALDTARNEGVQLDALSDGTRLQLLLAVKLAFAASQQRSELQIPLMLDEVLGTSDPERFGAIVHGLFQLVKNGWQVFHFTSQPSELPAWEHHLKAMLNSDSAANSDSSYAAADGARSLASAFRLNVVDLAAIRQLARKAPGYLLEEPLPEPAIPSPEGHTPSTYAEILHVDALRPFEEVSAQHSFYLLEDRLDTLRQVLQLGAERIGALAALAESEALRKSLGLEDIDARVQVMEATFNGWKKGRGKKLPISLLSSVPRLSERFLPAVQELLIELDGDAKALIDALKDQRVSGFRTNAREAMEEWFEAEGYLSSEERLSSADLWAHVVKELPHLVNHPNYGLSWLQERFGRLKHRLSLLEKSPHEGDREADPAQESEEATA